MLNESRIKLQRTLEQLLGSRNVYFQPPASVLMNYPAIVYSQESIDSKYASDNIYNQYVHYQITIIDRNPDSKFIEKMFKLPYTSYNRRFISDGLYHDVFTIKIHI